MIGATGMPAGGAYYSGGNYYAGGTGVGTSGGMYGAGGGPGGTMYAAGRSVGYGGPGMGPGTAAIPTPGCCGVGSGPSDTSCCVGGPEAACGGLGSMCCEGAGTMVGEGNWHYVGDGRGTHTGPGQGGGYQYVGDGAGSYTRETIVQPYGCRIRPCCLLLLPLLLLPFLLPYLLNYFQTEPPKPTSAPLPPPPRIPVPIPAPKPPAPPPVTPAPPAPLPPLPVPVPVPVPAPAPEFGIVGTCIGWGDPHLRTFDGTRADYYSPGEYYIVKTPTISIQGRYLPTKFTNGLAVTKMIAIGGPLLKGHKLIIGPLTATWDGAPILTGFPSKFDQPGVDLQYNSEGALVDTAMDASKKHIVHAKILDGSPQGILVQVNRWTASAGNEYVNWKITMHARAGQDGHCGNFNGNAADDDRMAVRQRVGTQGVPAGPELLFATKTPVTAANRPDINNCPTATMKAAEADCKATFGGVSPKMSCLTDYCFAGKEVALNK